MHTENQTPLPLNNHLFFHLFGKGNTRGVNQSCPTGSSGAGSTTNTHTGDSLLPSELTTFSKTDTDFLVQRMEESPPDI